MPTTKTISKLKNTPPKKRPAIFLDRDGTIIHQVELPSKESDLKILSGAARAIKAMNDLGYLVIIVTNQPVVARGIITLKEAKRVNEVLVARFLKQGARIDGSYFCPHHPQANMKKYRMTCKCRKPDIGMIQEAKKKYNIDMKRSFMVGDTTRDTLAGNRAKLTTILVQTGHGGKDVWQFEGKPDYTVKHLEDAAKIIKKLTK